ncbi:MAG: DUF2490 domain-containing protein, partial [Phycisphaerales bacterium]
MESGIRGCGFAGLICLVLAGGMCLGDEDESFEYWAQFGVAAELNEDWDFKLGTELKYGDDAGELYCQNVDFGLVYKGIADWVDFGLMYKREYQKDGAGDWRGENRPHLNLTFKGKLLGLDVSDRSRFEFRNREAREDYWRYRNMIKVKLPWEFTSLKLRPYFAQEFFIDLNAGQYNKNRFYSGLYYKLNEHLGGAVFYLWESPKRG